MAHNLEIRATARGPDFYYREVHEWAHGTEEGTQWVLNALAEIGELAKKLGADGKGDIAGDFLIILDGKAVSSFTVEKLSKKDVAKIERAFYMKALDLVSITESK